MIEKRTGKRKGKCKD